MPTSNDSERLIELVNVFLERSQRDEKPDIEEYCVAHPDLADEIRELFPTLVVMEDLHPATGEGEISDATKDFPDQIGDYRILGEIGRGGMGIVYEAEQESLGRRVALKVLPNKLLSQSARIRFQREARAAAKMHHTNIVPVFEVGQHGDCIFYAMQLIKGQSLDLVIDGLRDASAGIGMDTTFVPDASSAKEQRLANPASAAVSSSGLQAPVSHSSGFGRPTFYRSAAKIAHQTADAMAFAHARGVIHRDIKPSNLLLDTEGVIWVTDFGLAKSEEDDATLTQSGDYLGTLRYMSPERFRGFCDAKTDIYALGMTLYELVLQQPAFAAADRMKLIYIINQTEPAAPHTLDPNIPRDLETIILKAIDKSVDSRYSSAKAMALDLQRFINDEPIEARRLSSFEQLMRWSRRNKGLATSLASILALLVVMVIGATWAAIRQSDLRTASENSEALAKIAQERAENAQLSAETSQARAEEALGKVEESRRAEKLALETMELASNRASSALQIAEEAQQLAEASRQQIRRNSYYAEVNLAGRLMGQPGAREKIRQIVDEWSLASDRLILKGWEWHLLNESTQSDGIVLDGILNCRAAEWSHDGKMIAVADHNNVTIFDGTSGAVIGQSMTGHTGHVNAVAWNPDDTVIVSVADDSTARFWNVETRTEMREKAGPYEGRATRIAWSPSGERVAFSIDNKGLFVVAPFSDKEAVAQQLPDSPDFVRHLQWSPDETRLIGGTWHQNTMSIYDVQKQTPIEGKIKATRVLWNDDHEIASKIHSTSSGRIDQFDGGSSIRTQTLLGHAQWPRRLI